MTTNTTTGHPIEDDARIKALSDRLPIRYKPHAFDDWGLLRDKNGHVFGRIECQLDDKTFAQHREDKTDPYMSVGMMVVNAVNNLTQPVPSPNVGGDVKEALDAARKLRAYFENPNSGEMPYPERRLIWDKIERALTHAPAFDAVKVPEGYKLVPIAPTEAMIKRGSYEVTALTHKGVKCVYAAMLSAAPSDKRGG